MIQFELSGVQAAALEERLRGLKPDKVATIITRATKKAAQKVRTEGWKQIKGVYTIKQGDVYSRISMITGLLGTTIRIRGPFEGAEHFRTSLSRAHGVSMSVKRGKTARVKRSFKYGATYFKRDGTRRLPISHLYGPSVAQMFQNEEVTDSLEKVGMQKYLDELQRQIDLVIRGLA